MSDFATPIFEISDPPQQKRSGGTHPAAALNRTLAKSVAEQGGKWVAVLTYPAGKRSAVHHAAWRIRSGTAAAWAKYGDFDVEVRMQEDGSYKVWARLRTGEQ